MNHKGFLGRLVVGVAAWRPNTPPLRSPDAFGLTYQEVSFPSAHSDRAQLSGWLIPCDTPRALVILCPGIGSSRGKMLVGARCLNRSGFAVLLIDFRARASRQGNLCTLGVREPYDILGAVDWAESQSGLQHLPVGAMGESLGAASVLLAMARDQRIQAAVLEACFSTLDAAIAERCRWLLGPLARSGASWFRRCLLERLQIDSSSVSPLEHIALVSPRPLLLIHDSLDLFCPRRAADSLYAQARAPKELWVAPFTPHVRAALTARAEYESRVSAFFCKYFSRPAETLTVINGELG